MDSCDRACVRSEGAAVDRNDRLRYVSGQTRSTTTGLCGITEIMIPRLIRETNSNSVIVVIGLLVDSGVQGGSHTVQLHCSQLFTLAIHVMMNSEHIVPLGNSKLWLYL